jgi:8-oxo-dGTP pyrophosphatase MutT (NUDIX family)
VTSPAPARPAATLVLLRPARDDGSGFEVLLTKRPDSMRFGPGMYVFPGGRVEAGESAANTAVRETAEETGIEVDAAALLPLTRWVTPYSLPTRFDARFFGALVAPGTDVVHGSDEVAAWSWLTPIAALEGMAAGRLPMWQPTVVTLQQLEGVGSRGELEAAFGREAADGSPADVSDARPLVGPERWFASEWAGGIEARRSVTRVIGRTSWVVVSPSDPTEATIDDVLAAAHAAGASLAGVVIEDLEPEHHAGVELYARGFQLPVAGPPGADRLVPYEVVELGEGVAVPFGDVPIAVRITSSGASSASRWADRAGRLRVVAGD